MDAKPFRQVLADARKERGMSVDDLGLEVRRLARDRDLGRAGASLSSLQKHAAGLAAGSPSPTLMELVAEVLGIPPTDFAEYRLAQARLALDEREVGLEQALAYLEQIEKTIRQQAGGAARRAEPPEAGTARRPPRARRAQG